jgi:hypothetical protein
VVIGDSYGPRGFPAYACQLPLMSSNYRRMQTLKIESGRVVS